MSEKNKNNYFLCAHCQKTFLKKGNINMLGFGIYEVSYCNDCLIEARDTVIRLLVELVKLLKPYVSSILIKDIQRFDNLNKQLEKYGVEFFV